MPDRKMFVNINGQRAKIDIIDQVINGKPGYVVRYKLPSGMQYGTTVLNKEEDDILRALQRIIKMTGEVR